MPAERRCNRPRPPQRRRVASALALQRPSAGFTYLLLLFVVAITGAGLAALGQHWQQAAQRERETELLFRGLQIAAALQRYADATPEGQPRQPETLEALLTDARLSPPRHHLRRLWADPFTGQADWVLLRNEAQGILGVRSRAQRSALRRAHWPAGVSGTGGAQPSVSDWVFLAGPATRAAPARAEQGAPDATNHSQTRSTL